MSKNFNLWRASHEIHCFVLLHDPGSRRVTQINVKEQIKPMEEVEMKNYDWRRKNLIVWFLSIPKDT